MTVELVETNGEYVPVRRDVLAQLQKNASMGAKVYGTRDVVVSEAREAPGTLKSLAAPAGIGAILAMVADWDSIKDSETVKKHWWLPGAALLITGYIMRRRNSPHASAIIAVGAALLMQAYRKKDAEDQAKKNAPAPAPSPPIKPAMDTAGPVGASMPIVHPIDDRTAWIQSGGQWARVQLAAPLRPALPPAQQPQAQTFAQQQTTLDNAAALAAAAFAG